MPRKAFVRLPDTLDGRLTQLDRMDLEGFAREIFDIMYLNRRHWTYDPAKEWNSDTANAIAEAIRNRLNIHPRPTR